MGTAAGAIAGGIGALLLHVVPAIPQWIILLAVIAPLAVLASSKAIFRLAPLTGALVLLLAGTASLGFALSRVAEIALGTIIGVLFSLFFLPERATAVLVERAAAILETLGGFAVVLLSSPDSPDHERIALKIRGLFAQLQNDLKEVEQETHRPSAAYRSLSGTADPPPAKAAHRRQHARAAPYCTTARQTPIWNWRKASRRCSLDTPPRCANPATLLPESAIERSALHRTRRQPGRLRRADPAGRAERPERNPPATGRRRTRGLTRMSAKHGGYSRRRLQSLAALAITRL